MHVSGNVCVLVEKQSADVTPLWIVNIAVILYPRNKFPSLLNLKCNVMYRSVCLCRLRGEGNSQIKVTGKMDGNLERAQLDAVSFCETGARDTNLHILFSSLFTAPHFLVFLFDRWTRLASVASQPQWLVLHLTCPFPEQVPDHF